MEGRWRLWLWTENQVFVSGVVPTTVLVEQELSQVSQVCTRLDARSPSVTPVASREKLLSLPEQKPGLYEDFAHGDRDSSYNPVWKVPPDKGNRSARLPFQIPYAIVDKHILSDDSQGKETASVSAASECAPVAVEEKRVFLSGVVPPLDNVEQKYSVVSSQLVARSHWSTHVASGEKLLCSPLYSYGAETALFSIPMGFAPRWREGPLPGFCEDFSHGDRDSSYNPVSQGPPDNGSKFQPDSLLSITQGTIKAHDEERGMIEGYSKKKSQK